MENEDQNIRLALLERGFAEVNDDIKELASEVRKLVVVMTQQAEDRASLARAFGRIDNMDEQIGVIRKQLTDMDISRLERDNAALERERAIASEQKRNATAELVKVAILIAASLVMYHFGIKLL